MSTAITPVVHDRQFKRVASGILFLTATMVESFKHEKEQPPLLAEGVIDLSAYESVQERSRPLVASIEYLVQKFGFPEPAILEIGPVPTFHYKLSPDQLSLSGSAYDPELAVEHTDERNVSPTKFLAERHSDWPLAAVSPHDIPEDAKQVLLGRHANLFLSQLGPDRVHGINPEDVWDEEYMNGGDIMRHYPVLFEKCGGKRPDIIFGRHVFDAAAREYPVGKLSTVAMMLLQPGGLLVSQVYGSKPGRSHVPMKGIHFPFFSEANMRLVATIGFSRRSNDERDWVFAYQKVADAIRPGYLQALQNRP